MPSPMGHDVFISHSAKDKAVADAVCAALEANGVRCWIAPRDIRPGENWATSILHGIAGCRMMVLVFSTHTNSSNHIRREVERAVNRGIPIAPLRIEDAMPKDDLEYFLSSSHWMDALTPPLEKHLREFTQKVRGLLGVGGEAPGTAPALWVAPTTAASPQAATAVPKARTGARRFAVLITLLIVLSAAWGWRSDLRRLISGTRQQPPSSQQSAPGSAFSAPSAIATASVPVVLPATSPAASIVSPEHVSSSAPASNPVTLSHDSHEVSSRIRAATTQSGYTRGDWLVQNLRSQVARITPLISTDPYAAVIQARVLESMAYRDPKTLDYVPLLATEWQISQDGLSITFEIRKGVTFSDGAPFTAEDVVFTYDWIMNPEVEDPREKQTMERVQSVTKTNDYQVVFKFREPYFQNFDLASSLGIMSKAFYGRYTPQQFNNSSGLLIGTGPYRRESQTDWKSTAGRIELIRNEGYWGMPASFDRLVFYQIESEATELAMFGKGDLDLVGVQPQAYELMLKNPDLVARSNHFEYTPPTAGFTYIAWNQQRDGKPTVFADKRVRQAMTMLTDRDGLCKNILLGYATVARGPFSPMSKQDDKSLQDWIYDPEKAKALLKEAGFEDRDGSGVLSLPDGRKLSFRLSYASNNETTGQVMRYVKDSYARAGIRVELSPEEWAIFVGNISTRKYDAISLGWSGGIEEDIYQMFDSSQVAGEGDNFISYSNPQFDNAVRAARTTVDEAKRMELWHQCARILHEDQPYTFLMVRKSLQFFDKRIQNVHESKVGLNFVPDSAMPLPWYVPTNQQKYPK